MDAKDLATVQNVWMHAKTDHIAKEIARYSAGMRENTYNAYLEMLKHLLALRSI